MINSLLVTASLLLGFWLAYLMGRQAGSRQEPPGGSPYRSPYRLPTHPTFGGRPLPYVPPPPPWVTQHQVGCTARPRALKERVRVCGGCGSELPHRHPQPPRTP